MLEAANLARRRAVWCQALDPARLAAHQELAEVIAELDFMYDLD
jgi:hypothetical protein